MKSQLLVVWSCSILLLNTDMTSSDSDYNDHGVPRKFLGVSKCAELGTQRYFSDNKVCRA
jgi:hypothetical protein